MEKLYKNPAVVLGLSYTGLGLIRSLAGRVRQIFGFDYCRYGNDGFYSKYVKAQTCPHPAGRKEELLAFLMARFRLQPEKPVLFPASDEFVVFLSENRAALSQYFLFNLAPENIINSIIDKRSQYLLAEKEGLFVPKAYYFDTPQDAAQKSRHLKYPLLVKGRYSLGWRQNFGGVKKGFKADTAGRLVEVCRLMFEKALEPIAQEIIPGPNTNHYKHCVYINKKGDFLASCCMRKIRQYPAEFGVASSIESVRHDELKALGVSFFKKIDFTGIGSLEFKLDPRDNRFKYIELNPRFWMQNELAAVSGVNFAMLQYQDLVFGRAPVCAQGYKTGLKWIDPVCDLKSFLAQKRHGWLFLFGWIIFLARCRVFSVFCLKDLRQFFRSIDYGMKIFRLPALVKGGGTLNG